MPYTLILVILLSPSVGICADLREPDQIKVISDDESDNPHHPAELQQKLRHKRASAIEFRDKAGKLKRRLNFSDHLRKRKEHEERFIEVKSPRSKKLVVVSRISRDWDEKNPYTVRRSSTAEIEWYDQEGNRLGAVLLGGGNRVIGLSDSGSVTAIVDAGFDPESLANSEIPGMTNTEPVKGDRNLVDHKLIFYRPDASIIAEQRFPGPSAPPDGVAFSPSGEWVIYSIGSAETYLRNLKSGTVQNFKHVPIAWEVEDTGRLVGWKTEGKGGRWENYQGMRIWKSDAKVNQRKFIREVGAADITRTEEIREKLR